MDQRRIGPRGELRTLRACHDRTERAVHVEEDACRWGRSAERIERNNHPLMLASPVALDRLAWWTPSPRSRSRPTPASTPAPGGTSAFPPIADYGFIADREVTALIAPSGNIEWLCLPRPDAPSVFGAILDRSAGAFRLGPAELFAPAGRRYIPGTNILETTWQTSTGWLVVRDALIVGPWSDDRRLRTYRRPPPDYVAEHVLIRELRCVNGHVDVQMNCEPVFDYGRTDAAWEYTGTGYGEAIARGGEEDPELRLTTSMRLGLEGRSALAVHQMEEGDRDFVALSWTEDEPPLTYEDAADRMRRTAGFWRGWLNHGAFPDHPWRGMLQRSALDAEGTDVRADRRAARRVDDVAPRDARRRTELGLPLQLGARCDVRPVGSVHARLRLRGQQLLLLHRRSDRRRIPAARAVRGRRRCRPQGIDAGSSDGLRGRPSGPDRQRRVRPGAARHLGCAPARRAPPHALRRVPLGRDLGQPGAPGRMRDRPMAASRTAGSGRTAGNRGISPRRRSCVGWRWTAAPCWRRRWATPSWWSAGGRSRTRSRPTCWRTASTNAASSRSRTDRPRSTRRCSSGCCWGSCRRTIRGCGRPSWRSRRSSRSTAWSCATAWTRRTTGSPVRRGRSRSARSGWSPRWWRSASSTKRARCWRSCWRWRARSASTRRSSTRGRAGTSGTSRRRSPTSR